MNVVPKSPGFSRNNEAVFNPANVKLELDALKAMRDRGEQISKTIKQACVDLILESAKQQVCTTGKWMISVGRDSVDMNWEMFARATANGHLGCGAKVSPSRELFDTDKALIRIYVGDFTNKPEVQRVLLALQKDVKWEITWGFKPDVFTDLGIYSRNPWLLPPTIDSVKEALQWFQPSL